VVAFLPTLVGETVREEERDGDAQSGWYRVFTIQIHALPSAGTSSTVHFGSQGIPAPTVNCAKVARPNMVRSVSDMAEAQDEQIPQMFVAMSDTPAIEVNR
jgi:hypothetical protein